MRDHYDVVIVGGGAAGIGAARTLAGRQVSTLLLEASSRLGGRAHTQAVQGMPLDLGCGWLHSADRNAWTGIAEAAGLAVDRRTPAWGMQYRDLGFSPADQDGAGDALAEWRNRMTAGPASDRAADALTPGCRWNDYIAAITGFISGVAPEDISAADYLAYDEASTDCNWRVPSGYGALVAGSLPSDIDTRLSTPVERVSLDGNAVLLRTAAGAVSAGVVIMTVSTAVLAGDAIRLPAGLDPWREAARHLPLGRNEKAFLGIDGDSPFVEETQVLGSPGSRRSAGHYIRPFGWPVIECFLGGDSARVVETDGADAVFGQAIDELAGLFGNDVRRLLQPLIVSQWAGDPYVGGGYSCALPGHAGARALLARPYEDRIFFAGEATNATDFTTAHGAHDSGVRAAGEAIAALKRAM
jgi:monoamine oxidase